MPDKKQREAETLQVNDVGALTRMLRGAKNMVSSITGGGRSNAEVNAALRRRDGTKRKRPTQALRDAVQTRDPRQALRARPELDPGVALRRRMREVDG